jgi:hypothetical protein
VNEYTKFDAEICTDCYMSINGVNEDFQPDGDRTFDVCPEWDSWYFDSIYPEDDTNHEGEPSHGFSKSQCDGCHTTLHGERYSMEATYLGPLAQETS